ncbi:MAG: NADH-quinone oxidoreductase subunit I, partial [Planctomycetia bacterium]
YPEVFVIEEFMCFYCVMFEQYCQLYAIDLTNLFYLTGLSREEMIFNKEKLLGVFDKTVSMNTDPVRTTRGRLGVASEPASHGLTGSSSVQS